MLSSGEDAGAIAGPALCMERKAEKQPWRSILKDVPHENIKESICQNLENNKLLSADFSLISILLSIFTPLLSCQAPFFIDCSPEAGRSTGKGNFAPDIIFGPRMPCLTLQFQGCV